MHQLDSVKPEYVIIEYNCAGKLNRTMCDVLDERGDVANNAGIFNFTRVSETVIQSSWICCISACFFLITTQVSDTEITFRTPCERSVAVTNWPDPGSSYREIVVVNLNGDSSPTCHDVERGILSKEDNLNSLVYVTDQCIGIVLQN